MFRANFFYIPGCYFAIRITFYCKKTLIFYSFLEMSENERERGFSQKRERERGLFQISVSEFFKKKARSSCLVKTFKVL
jgi:hypothetical protein